ncbi:MAG TPA: amidohydrolase family protein, partial [Gracilimonas sp.]|uniref:amidohydrolase family protein n=1 Tax=Gracilimonas sp. TaxID=1974203 RepID=UPI002D985B3A|nr:amidohydrolase family protein [Gracilimonas sp.]
MKKLLVLLFSILLTQILMAQEADTTMTFEEYQPESTLVVPGEEITSAKFPFVDVHSHLWRMASMDLKETTAEMDSLNMKVLVNLSGRSGETLKAMVDAAREQAPDRFVVFANIDFDDIDDPGWTERAVAQLQEDYDNGARGVKIFKNLGLTVLDSEGNRVQTDDPRIDPVWAKAGELGIPVLIHTGEPAEFWEPIDNTNER